MKPYLSRGIPSVPKGISEVLSWTGGGINHLNGQARIALGLGGFIWPVGLCNLLPHHHIEPGTGLVAKYEAGIIIIPLCVDEESPTEVHSIELMVPWWRRKIKLWDCSQKTAFIILYTNPRKPHTLSFAHQQQCQGRSWQSERAPCPDGGQPN